MEIQGLRGFYQDIQGSAYGGVLGWRRSLHGPVYVAYEVPIELPKIEARTSWFPYPLDFPNNLGFRV